MDILSFSALADFWSCPRLYHYRHELKLPVPRHSAEARRAGSMMHQQLDLHAQGHTPPMASDPAFAHLWRTYTGTVAPYAALPCFSEWSCQLPVQIQGEIVWLHGRMDRLYVQERSLILFDFKSGQGEPGPLNALQLDFYAWLLWQVQELLAPQGIDRILARAVWLEQPGLVLERSFDATTLPALTAQFMHLLETLLGPGSRDVPEPRSAAGKPWCTMCEYQRLCPEGSYYPHAQ